MSGFGFDTKTLNKQVNDQNDQVADLVRRALTVNDAQAPITLALAQLRVSQAIHDRLGDILEMLAQKR